ncbi:MAG: hypothetical protein HUK02_08600 [Bacteroidaceae bacterium]|nr:hypothetical protein [Bacteroidaceae bacterium]
MMTLRERIIKQLGGYTSKEYTHIERRFQSLLDSKTTNTCVELCNEYIWRVLNDFDKYAQKTLYGLPPHKWSAMMYNVIHNNTLRILIRYLNVGSSVIYRLDTTLDSEDQLKDLMEAAGIADESEVERANPYKMMWEELEEQAKDEPAVAQLMQALKQKYLGTGDVSVPTSAAKATESTEETSVCPAENN